MTPRPPRPRVFRMEVGESASYPWLIAVWEHDPESGLDGYTITGHATFAEAIAHAHRIAQEDRT